MPFTQCLYLILAATSLYIPIMGRVGAGNNAEVMVGLLIGAKFGLLFTCVVSTDFLWEQDLDGVGICKLFINQLYTQICLSSSCNAFLPLCQAIFQEH